MDQLAYASHPSTQVEARDCRVRGCPQPHLGGKGEETLGGDSAFLTEHQGHEGRDLLITHPLTLHTLPSQRNATIVPTLTVALRGRVMRPGSHRIEATERTETQGSRYYANAHVGEGSGEGKAVAAVALHLYKSTKHGTYTQLYSQ